MRVSAICPSDSLGCPAYQTVQLNDLMLFWFSLCTHFILFYQIVSLPATSYKEPVHSLFAVEELSKCYMTEGWICWIWIIDIESRDSLALRELPQLKPAHRIDLIKHAMSTPAVKPLRSDRSHSTSGKLPSITCVWEVQIERSQAHRKHKNSWHPSFSPKQRVSRLSGVCLSVSSL